MLSSMAASAIATVIGEPVDWLIITTPLSLSSVNSS